MSLIKGYIDDEDLSAKIQDLYKACQSLVFHKYAFIFTYVCLHINGLSLRICTVHGNVVHFNLILSCHLLGEFIM